MINTFDQLYTKYKDKFIYNHGQAKFDTIQNKVHDSKRVEQLNNISIKQRTDPSQADFGAAIQSTTYFIFSTSDTSAMAEFIATKFWNETINSKYRLCSDQALFLKGENILKRWGKYYGF